MQPLNDDTNELFRKAAEEYPLNTGGADWDKVLKGIRAPEKDDPDAPYALLRWYKRSLFAACLVIAGFLVYELFNQQRNTQYNHDYTTVPGKQQLLPAVPALDNRQNKQPASEEKQLVQMITPAKPPQQAASTLVSRPSWTTRGVDAENLEGKTDPLISPRSISPIEAVVQQPEARVAQKSSNTLLETNDNVQPVVPDFLHASENRLFTPIPADSVNIFILALGSLHRHDSPSKDTLPLKTPLLPVVRNSHSNRFTAVSKGFYTGLVLAPDYSTVKMQQVKKLGYGIGLVAGYRISRRWAVEAGINLERKYYYSKGEYLKTAKLMMPDGIQLLKVDGLCNMIELPLSLRYFITTKEKTSWYVSAGMSSYLMGKEEYNYLAKRNNTIYQRRFGYDQSTKNWFSVALFSFGYEQKIGLLGNLRLEPYIKVPVNGGLGIGSLPISSAGINFGLIKKIGK